MKPILQIGLMLFCLVGTTVSAVPTAIEDRHEYSTSLNSIASTIMNWYGSLIVSDDPLSTKIGERAYFDTSKTGDQWLEYRSHYPQNITQVLIKHTELLRSNNDYLFNVHSVISYENPEKKILTKSLKETFLFSGAFINGESSVSFPIKNINLVKSEEISPLETTKYSREHYKVREFVYAWLTYMDDLNTLTPIMNGGEWLNQASYSLEIGANKTHGPVEKILKKRKKTLAKGGHLLSALDVIIPKNSNETFILDLLLEWKGVNDKGQPVLANIHQELKVQIREDKSWIVVSIKEKHLLPIIAPWMGLLC